MDSGTSGTCDLCGRPGIIHLTEIRDGGKVSRSFCPDHVPPEVRDRLPFGPTARPPRRSRSSAGNWRCSTSRSDPVWRAALKAEVEELIADIEAGRRRLGD